MNLFSIEFMKKENPGGEATQEYLLEAKGAKPNTEALALSKLDEKKYHQRMYLVGGEYADQ